MNKINNKKELLISIFFIVIGIIIVGLKAYSQIVCLNNKVCKVEKYLEDKYDERVRGKDIELLKNEKYKNEINFDGTSFGSIKGKNYYYKVYSSKNDFYYYVEYDSYLFGSFSDDYEERLGAIKCINSVLDSVDINLNKDIIGYYGKNESNLVHTNDRNYMRNEIIREVENETYDMNKSTISLGIKSKTIHINLNKSFNEICNEDFYNRVKKVNLDFKEARQDCDVYIELYLITTDGVILQVHGYDFPFIEEHIQNELNNNSTEHYLGSEDNNKTLSPEIEIIRSYQELKYINFDKYIHPEFYINDVENIKKLYEVMHISTYGFDFDKY